MNSLPSLVEVEFGPPPGLPSDEPTLATAGSSSAIFAIWFCSGTMAWYDVSGGASVVAMMRSVSSAGNAALGVTANM